MKRIALILLSVLLIASCSKDSGDRLSQIEDKGQITVAMEGTWSPWTYHDASGQLVGYDTEVAKGIAEYLGVEAVFVEGEWDGLLAGLDAGRYDIMANGVDVTPERQEAYDFSIPYAYNRTAVITRTDTANTISSTYAEVAESYGAKVTGVDDLNQTFELLRTGRIDATLNAEVVFYDYMEVHPDAPFKIACIDDVVHEVAIPVKKGENSAALLEKINEAITEMSESGRLSELSMKYFGTDISRQ